MKPQGNPPVEDQLAALFEHLGIRRAHLGANMPEDFRSFVRSNRELVSSLTLVGPYRMTDKMLSELDCPLLVFNGERGPADAALLENVADRPDSRVVTLSGYDFQIWSDIAADRTQELETSILSFLNDTDQERQLETLAPDADEGMVGDIAYRIRGTGPPLILLPLTLAPAQWEPLIPALSEHYCTIALSGSALGIAAYLENRARTPGYRNLVRNLIEPLNAKPYEEVLEVGCGTGVVARWIGRRMNTAKRITAIDINRHLLSEATRFVNQEQLDDKVQLREGNAEEIPFPDNTFDVTLCCTVLEEVNADRAIAEMVRVTKPGGRVGIAVRAVDIPRFINLPLPADLKSRLEEPGAWGGGAAPEGCADASLYGRMQIAGLSGIEMLPQLAVFDSDFGAQDLEKNILPLLDPKESTIWRTAMNRARREGTFFLANPFHCAIGSKSQ